MPTKSKNPLQYRIYSRVNIGPLMSDVYSVLTFCY